MSVRNIVKVMNFHSLLRVNSARRKVAEAQEYESHLNKVISAILTNRNFNKDYNLLRFNENAPELNIYIGSDLGFCSSFNSDVIKQIKSDNPKNYKIIIGKRVKTNAENILIYSDKEKFSVVEDQIYTTVLDLLTNHKVKCINIIYIHYYNLNQQALSRKRLLPVEFKDEEIEKYKLDDYSVEGDIVDILWNLISFYVKTEISIAEAWSWASENVERQNFTSESLKKIDEQAEIKMKAERKEQKQAVFKEIVELNNKKNFEKLKEGE